MRKRILIISAVFPPEQVTSALLNYDMAKELARKYDVTVLRPYPTRPIGMKFDYDGLKDESFKTVLIESYTHPQSQLLGRFFESYDFGKKCAEYIKKRHKDIDAIYNGPWQLFGVYIVARTAVKYKIPYIMTVQDIYPESILTGHNYPQLIQWGVKALLLPMDKYYMRHAEKVRTISKEMVEYMARTRHLPLNHYLALDNWQNEEDFVNLPKHKKGENLVFSYVGSMNLHSNVELIIQSFSDANIENSELRLYGGGNRKEQCVQLAKSLGQSNIIFDQVSRDMVPAIQNEADVLVLALPKGNGGLCLPSKLTSYMLSGKPVLASIEKNSASVRYINEAKCGITVEPDDKDALKEGFIKFGKMNTAELKKMGENSKMFADANLTRKANLPKLVALFDEIIENINKTL